MMSPSEADYCQPSVRGAPVYLLLAVPPLAYSLWNGLQGPAAVCLLVCAFLSLTFMLREAPVHIPDAFKTVAVLLAYLSVAGTLIGTDFWPSLLSNYLAGILLGAMGSIAAYLLSKETGGRGMVPLFALFFGMSAACSWEMLEYLSDLILGTVLQPSLTDTMIDMAGVSFGALTMAVAYHWRSRKGSIYHRMVTCFMRINPELVLIVDQDGAGAISALMEGGEGERLEFKATLRTNLLTGEKDKRIEHASLKTLVAFLNSSGGTLLIGVGDDGSLRGVDVDSFESRDKMRLHLTHLISGHIGNRFLPFISSRLITVDGKEVMRLDCRPSDSPVFFRDGKEEYFYIRSGPSSLELRGSELISYIRKRFHV